MSRLDNMTPRELLMVLTRMGQLVAKARENEGPVAPAKGPRGMKRRAKRRRAKALERRLQRNSWRAYGEEEKRRAAA